jgi:hypothetical protein
MARKKKIISMRKILKKLGIKNPQKVWYRGEDFGHCISFDNDDVVFEIDYETKE